MIGFSDDTDMDRFPVSLVRGATPRTPAARSRACREPAGLRSRLAARPASCGGDLESHYRGPGLLIWAERCAGSLLVLVSCSVVQFDPSGRGPEAMGPVDVEGAAAPRGQPLRDVNGA